MKTTCSHVLLWVSDLHQAVRDYRRLGFTVDYATAKDKARHAHIWFTNGPVIELLTTPSTAKYFKWPIDLIAGRGSGARMVRWPQGGEGFCDVAVVTEAQDLIGELAALRAAGVPTGRAVRWRRTKPDGQQTTFRLAYPRNDRLPFIVTPYDPPQHPAHAEHANGATELHRVRMGVRAEDAETFRLIVGDDPTFLVEPAHTTRVLGIELAGLRGELDPALRHGAVLEPVRTVPDIA